jgi:hypothetical protein
VESFLGEIDNWPTKIIKFLFLDEPTAETVFEVSPFFYGHGVPLCIGSNFFNLCNEHGGFLVQLTMTVLYSVWNTGEDTSHLAPYYDTRHSKFMWING